MDALNVCLFGQFQVQYGEEILTGAFPHKLQELFCYLLLFRDNPHPRETLASLLWSESTTPHSRRNLRQALWQLRSPAVLGGALRDCDVLHVDAEWIQLSPEANLWLDIQVFEGALSRTEGVPGHALDRLQAEALATAVDLYRGDLLQGCYQDWCLYERERLQNAYLHTLEKLMDYCQACGEYQSGLAYGDQALQCDGARERTHQRLMRLHYLAGERAAALRQYDRCVEALQRELAVKPAARTVALYQQIRAGQFSTALEPSRAQRSATRLARAGLPEMVEQLQELREALARLQDQVQDALDAAQQIGGDRE
jgi:DNA-binding SARP family transcriptional activator